MEDLSTKHRKIIAMKENNNTVEPRFTDTRLIRTSDHYGQVALFLGKENPYKFSQFNQLNTHNTPSIRNTFYSPLGVPRGLTATEKQTSNNNNKKDTNNVLAEKWSLAFFNLCPIDEVCS